MYGGWRYITCPLKDSVLKDLEKRRSNWLVLLHKALLAWFRGKSVHYRVVVSIVQFILPRSPCPGPDPPIPGLGLWLKRPPLPLPLPSRLLPSFLSQSLLSSFSPSSRIFCLSFSISSWLLSTFTVGLGRSSGQRAWTPSLHERPWGQNPAR